MDSRSGAVTLMRPEQIGEVAAAMSRAFADDPLLVYALPDPSERAKRSQALFADGLRYAERVGAVYVPAEGPIGAAMCWPLPYPELDPDDPANPDTLTALLGSEAGSRFAAAVGPVEELSSRLVPPPSWHLPALAVNPAHQGRGIGSALMRAFLARATELELPAGLTTWAPSNVPFYRRLGLEVVAAGVEPSSGLDYWLMARFPTAQAPAAHPS
jgi:ribosomal protein S18 acetylase RimI-like enzyme